jgi:hypothetical protein
MNAKETREVEQDLAALLADLQTQHHIVPDSLLVYMRQNMFVTGGPLRYFFVGTTSDRSITGDMISVSRYTCLFLKRQIHTPVSVAEVVSPDANQIAALLEISASLPLPPAKTEKRPRDIDEGICGLFLFRSSTWRQIENANCNDPANEPTNIASEISRISDIHLMGFTNVAGFMTYLANVISHIPHFQNWPGPRRDMDTEWAFMGLGFGLNLTEAQGGDPAKITRCRELLAHAVTAFRRRDVESGKRSLIEIQKMVASLDLASSNPPALTCSLLREVGLRC